MSSHYSAHSKASRPPSTAVTTTRSKHSSSASQSHAPPSTYTKKIIYAPSSIAGRSAASSHASHAGRPRRDSIVGSDGSLACASGDTPVHKAARNGDLAAIRIALADSPSDLNKVNDNGRTPLHVAARRGQTDAVRLLLRRGASQWIKDSSGKTALMDACETESLGSIEALTNIKNATEQDLTQIGSTLVWANDGRLYRSIDIMLGTTRPFLPAIFAAYPPARDAFRNSDPARAIPLGENEGPSQAEKATQALLLAIQNNNHAAIANLLDSGADPARKSSEGVFPLVLAVEDERVRSVEQLLAAGADPSVKRADGQPVLSIAAKRQNYRLVEALVRSGAVLSLTNRQGRTALISACSMSTTNVDCIQALMGANVRKSVNYADDGGDTAMMWAARRNNDRAIHLLLKNGGGPSAKMGNTMGHTPLMEAVEKDSLEAAKALLNYRPERLLQQRDFDGTSPLEKAVHDHKADMLDVLLAAGGPEALSDTDQRGDTPLITSAKAGDTDTFKALLSHADKDNLKQENRKGDTALVIAARNGHNDIVQAILDNSPSMAMIEKANSKGETALIAAAANSHLEPVQAIVQHVTLPAGRDRDGRTALHYAAANGDEDICNTLLQASGAQDNLQVRDRAGNTPLMTAITSFQDKTARAIVAQTPKEALPSQGPGDGSNLLHMAVQADSAEHPAKDTVASLLKAGADQYARDPQKRTPLALAADLNKLGPMDPLLAAEKHHHGTPDTQHTSSIRSLKNLLVSLYLAASKEHKEAGKKILDSGARPWLNTTKGSAFHKMKIYVSDGSPLTRFRSDREDGALSRTKFRAFVKEKMGDDGA